ncbi:hypothetical protein KIN20_009475 [Parelaphostrongylus tenuis]|uniref:Homeobox domain-containing protein n=1 Tax=Parelaphostrongylus tenuis TaxID=148309 RepID=A0AAD5QKP3_PARTN|nr:hypothetical protein KIN20_009475 [Parelaphostrongylus tenuis]
MLSMASAGSAFKPYYRPEHLLVSAPEARELKKLYSDPEPAISSPSENAGGKNRRKRTTFTQYQATILEKEYLSERYMVRDKRTQLAESLGLSEAQVKTWFQNRRAKDKREKKLESPQQSPPDSTNTAVIEDKVVDNSNNLSVVSPSVSVEQAATPPPQLKPASSPIIQSHQVLSGILQSGRLPEHQQYFMNLRTTPLESISPAFQAIHMQKADSFNSETGVKDIYKMPTNIYEQNFCSLYNQVPVNISSSQGSCYIPEPLAPISSNDTVGMEHHQLTAL